MFELKTKILNFSLALSEICLLSAKKPYISLTHNNTIFHGGSDGKASAYNVGDPGSIPGS